MEYLMLCHVTYGSDPGNDVLCGTAPIATSCNKKGTVGSGAFGWVSHEVISRGLEEKAENLQMKFDVDSWMVPAIEDTSCWTRKSWTLHCWKPLPSNVTEYTSLCVTVICKVQSWAVNCSIDTVVDSKPVYRHLTTYKYLALFVLN
jgi:hypothetical protein